MKLSFEGILSINIILMFSAETFVVSPQTKFSIVLENCTLLVNANISIKKVSSARSTKNSADKQLKFCWKMILLQMTLIFVYIGSSFVGKSHLHRCLTVQNFKISNACAHHQTCPSRDGGKWSAFEMLKVL